jgi:DNA-directed RNA polymerase subunit RPC12/RpoP
MEELEDRLLHCIDCGQDFIFSVGEQRYYHSKSLSQPKRCPKCRRKRKLSLVPDTDTGRKEGN